MFSNFKHLTNTRLSTDRIITDKNLVQLQIFRLLFEPPLHLHELQFHLLPQRIFKALTGAVAVSVCYSHRSVAHNSTSTETRNN